MNTHESLGICVPVAKQTVEQMEKAAQEAVSIGDSVEFRLDALENLSLDDMAAASCRLVASAGCPTILTLRPRSAGGQSKLTPAERQEFWSRVTAPGYLDLEADILCDRSWSGKARLDLDRVICSYHDFQRTPDLSALYREHRASGAGCYKYATAAESIRDVLQIHRFIRSVKEDGKRVIALSMGACGVATRIFGLSWGSFLTFASLDPESSTAPGQITAVALRDQFRVKYITPSTEVYGVLAKPVGHSLSPFVHNYVFRATGRDAVYVPFEAEDAAEFIDSFVRPATREIDWNFRGLSVTIPHKDGAFRIAEKSDSLSRKAQASNTLLVTPRRIEAFNTDVSALMRLLPPKGRRLNSAAVLGSGGAARGAVVALRELGYDVTVFARTPETQRNVLESLGALVRPWEERRRAACDVLVNATPLGMQGMSETLSIPDSVISGAQLAADMVYRPRRTPLLAQAERLGVRTLDGLRILIVQAVDQQKIWTGCTPNPHELLAAAERAMEEGA